MNAHPTKNHTEQFKDVINARPAHLRSPLMRTALSTYDAINARPTHLRSPLMRTAPINVGSPLMATETRSSDKHDALHGDLLPFNDLTPA